MGYIMERAALVDRMFHSVQLAFRRVPASLAVTTLLVCAFWGIASGIVGAVVVLMGVIAMRPMLKAGYDVRLAAGAITAGGTLGILIPPSVMLIVYAAVAGQSIVKLYAAAMLPGFFLTALYLAYILGWALINPRIAPRLSPDQYRVPVPDFLRRLEAARSGAWCRACSRPRIRPGAPDYRRVVQGLLVASVPVLLTIGVFTATWWYVVIHNAPEAATSSLAPPTTAAGPAAPATTPVAVADKEEKPQELGAAAPRRRPTRRSRRSWALPAIPRRRRPEARGAARRDDVAPRPHRRVGTGRIPARFYAWFWGLAGPRRAPPRHLLRSHGR